MLCTCIYVGAMCMCILCAYMHAYSIIYRHVYVVYICVCFVHGSMCTVYMCAHAYMCVLCAFICTQVLRTVHSDQCLMCSSCYRKGSDIFVQQSSACSDHAKHLYSTLTLSQADTQHTTLDVPRGKAHHSPQFTAKQTMAQKVEHCAQSHSWCAVALGLKTVCRTRDSGHTGVSLPSQGSVSAGKGGPGREVHPLAKLRVLRTNWVP